MKPSQYRNITFKDLGKAILLIGVAIFGTIYLLIGLIAKLIWKLKKQLYFLALLILAIYLPLLAFKGIVHAPRARAEMNGYVYNDKPTTEHDMIIKDIYDTFGKDANDAFKVLSCENHKLNPDAQNYNSDGSVDIGIMQINSVHQVNPKYLYDWHINIAVGYNIFKEQGWSPWTCKYMLK